MRGWYVPLVRTVGVHNQSSIIETSKIHSCRPHINPRKSRENTHTECCGLHNRILISGLCTRGNAVTVTGIFLTRKFSLYKSSHRNRPSNWDIGGSALYPPFLNWGGGHETQNNRGGRGGSVVLMGKSTMINRRSGRCRTDFSLDTIRQPPDKVILTCCL